MITTPTVFVVGAGASCVYGLPTGATLLDSARKLQPKDDTYQLICTGQDATKLNSVIHDLQEHGAESIDAYLQSRRHDADTQRIGRRIIAVLLAEALTTLKEPRGKDWLKYIFTRMFDEAEDNFEQFKQNRVTFVTFNFDTCIEDRFNGFLRSTYNDEAFGFPSVIHVHGELRLPDKLPKPTPGMPAPAFPPRDHFGAFSAEIIEWLSRAASDIRVVFDEIDEEHLVAARRAVSEAKVICFLGFGYGGRNLKRLGFPDRLKGDYFSMFGSACDLERGEQFRVAKRLPDIGLSGTKDCALAALRKLAVFRE